MKSAIVPVFLGLMISTSAQALDLSDQDELLQAQKYYSSQLSGAFLPFQNQRDLANEYKVLTETGAISDDNQVAPAVLSVFNEYHFVPYIAEAVGTAYGQVKDNDIVLLKETTLKQAYGIPINRAFSDALAKDKGYEAKDLINKTTTFGKFIRAQKFELFIKKHEKGLPLKPFHQQARDNEGYLFSYNTANASYSDFFSDAPYENPGIKSLVHFIEEATVSDAIQKNLDDKDRLKHSFQSLGIFAQAELHEVKPATLVEMNKDEKVSSSVIATVLSYAAQDPGTVFLLAFYGDREYRFFVVSLSSGHLNFAFAIDDQKPVPVLAASIPTTQLSTEAISGAIGYLMNRENSAEEQHRTPNLLGIFEMRVPEVRKDIHDEL